MTQLQAPLDDKKEETRKDSSLAKDLANHSRGQRVMLVTALHPANMQQPELALWDTVLTVGWAEPSSAGDAAVLVTSQQTLPSSQQGLAQEGQGAWPHKAAGRVTGHLGAGMLSRAAGELRSQSSQQDHGGRAARRLTHSDAHPRVGPWPPRCGAVGEATACSWGSGVGLQHGGLADWAHSPQPEMLPREMGRNHGY